MHQILMSTRHVNYPLLVDTSRDLVCLDASQHRQRYYSAHVLGHLMRPLAQVPLLVQLFALHFMLGLARFYVDPLEILSVTPSDSFGFDVPSTVLPYQRIFEPSHPHQSHPKLSTRKLLAFTCTTRPPPAQPLQRCHSFDRCIHLHTRPVGSHISHQH